MDFVLRKNLVRVFKDKYAITNISGQPCFYVESRMRLLKSLVVSDANGTPLLLLKKRYWRWFSRWDVKTIDGKKLFAIKRKRVPFSRKFNMIETGKTTTNKYDIEGKLFSPTFSIKRNGEAIASIKTDPTSAKKIYILSINEPEEVLRCLSTVIILDTITSPRVSLFGGIIKV